MRRDIIHAYEHASHAARIIRHRLIHEIHEHLLGRTAVPADPHFGVTVLKSLTLPAGTRDPLQAAARQFRQRHAQRTADQITPAYVPPVFIVGELENKIRPDRKSTRLNSSHVEISYAVFCLKKKKKKET